MNRADRVSHILQLEALAAAARARALVMRSDLADEATTELEREGAAPTWRLPEIGTVSMPLSKETVVVADPAALLAWCQERHPEQIRQVAEIYPAALTALLDRAVPDAGVVLDPATGEIIPGLAVRPGGVPGALTIRTERDAKAAYAAAGAHLLDQLMPGEKS